MRDKRLKPQKTSADQMERGETHRQTKAFLGQPGESNRPARRPN